MSEPWVYVGGTFDLFHYGHAKFLENCRKHGKVIVSLNTDDFASRYKREPIMSLGERMEALRACKWVDDICVNIGDEGSWETIELITNRDIKYIAHGDDWSGDSLLRQLGISQRWLDRNSIKMLYIPYTSGISTSEIIGRVRGDVHCGGNCSCRQGESSSGAEITEEPDQDPG